MKRLLVFLFAFALLSKSLIAQNLQDSLHQELSAIFEATSIPGFAYTIVNEQETLASEGYGYANLTQQIPYTPESVHNIGSVSKTFIAIAIMQLVEQGKLNLDTPINDILPFKIFHPKYPDTLITVKHLVTHTSGIKDTNFYDLGCYVLLDDHQPVKKNYKGLEAIYLRRMSKNEEQALGDFLESYLTKDGDNFKKKNFHKHAPGMQYEYSNIGSAVAAYVVEIVAQQDYADHVRENIMQPLEMNNSGWRYKDIPEEKHTMTYTTKGSEVPRYTLITYPDGGVRSSAADLGKYLQAMMTQDSRLMTSATFQEMFDMKFEGKEKVAVFWSIDRRNNIGHNGADPGIFTMISFDPKEKVGFTFTTNCSVHDDKELLVPTIEILRTLKKYSLQMQAATQQ